jgi:malonate-semialdehyde dehydrogenase (acetylating)/methylmalonate-semialdehyde dehydrogenase
VPVVDRVAVLFRFKGLLEEHLGELAELMTREHGKTREESAGEIRRGIESVVHACAIPTLMMGETLENIAAGVDCETVRQPLGVFAVVTPYNFPVMIPLWFWPFAVATGNTVVLKRASGIHSPTSGWWSWRRWQGCRWRAQRRSWRSRRGGRAAGAS